MAEPVWDDERIERSIAYDKAALERVEMILIRYKMKDIRNDYEAKLAELTAENAALRQRVQWEPVPQSLEYDLITYAIKNGEIEQGYRICRRVLHT
jgi:hypothetical protein